MKEKKMANRPFDLAGFHAETVRNFSRVSDICVGLFGNEWIPGAMSTFNNRLRKPWDATRPLALNLEVTQHGGLTLSWASAKPSNGHLVFHTLGKIDFRAPIVSGGRGSQLNLDRPKHRMNCKLGCDILRKIADIGYDTLRGENPQLDEPRWPKLYMSFQPGHEVVDHDKLTALAMAAAPAELVEQYRTMRYQDLVTVDGKMIRVAATALPDELLADGISNNLVVEDYSPILGAVDRPLDIGAADDVEIELPNPAAKILARRGIDDVENVAQWVLDEMSVEFRAALPEYELTEESVCDAFLNADSPVSATVDIKTAIVSHPQAAVVQLRRVASGRAQREATDQELLAAALSPGQPVILNRNSKIQINTVEAWQESMPAWYAGDFISPVNWKPAHLAAKEAMVEAEA
jgi:hypothetical protein